MDSARDWRDSFSQLEATRKRKSGKQAADAVVAGILSLEQPIAEAGLILAAPEAKPAAKPGASSKRKSKSKAGPSRGGTAKRTKAPARPATRKAATRKPAKSGPSEDKAKAGLAVPKRQVAAKAAAPRRQSVAKSVVAKVGADAPALPLPDLETPLAGPALFAEPVAPADPVPAPPAAPIAPLPRKASLAPYRKGGLIEAIGFWLRTTARRAKAKLGASTALARSVEPVTAESEIEELKAENERLRRQLEALLVLSDAAQFKFQS